MIFTNSNQKAIHVAGYTVYFSMVTNYQEKESGTQEKCHSNVSQRSYDIKQFIFSKINK